jgi:hypothetical protein
VPGFIDVTGPDRAGEFIATLSDGQTCVLVFWADLESLKLFWGTDQVHGNVLNLSRRHRPGRSD